MAHPDDIRGHSTTKTPAVDEIPRAIPVQAPTAAAGSSIQCDISSPRVTFQIGVAAWATASSSAGAPSFQSVVQLFGALSDFSSEGVDSTFAIDRCATGWVYGQCRHDHLCQVREGRRVIESNLCDKHPDTIFS
jgi:hypothetical protein